MECIREYKKWKCSHVGGYECKKKKSHYEENEKHSYVTVEKKKKKEKLSYFSYDLCAMINIILNLGPDVWR